MSNYKPLKKTMHVFNSDNNFIDLFAFNEFSEDVVFLRSPEWDKSISRGKTLDDDDIVMMRYYLSRVHDFEPPKGIVGECCYISGKHKSFNPVKKYIESEKWDGVERLEEWLIKSTNCKDSIYTRQAAAKFLIAAVSRIYNPGCKFDHMIILEGNQRIGKSTLVESLAGEWFLDTNFGHKDKDLIDCMRGSFVIEISELSGMSKKDVDWLKSFLSRKVDKVRLAYAARTKNFKRKCVFMGTYNPSGNNMYLRDDTGNSRFWPIECGKSIDINYVKENILQLWAEALVRYKTGEKIFIDDQEALNILSGIHGERELESPTHHTIKEWLKSQGDFVAMNDIISSGLKITATNKMPKELLSLSTTIGIIMRKLQWTKGTNNNRHIYYRPGYIHTPALELAEVWDE